MFTVAICDDEKIYSEQINKIVNKYKGDFEENMQVVKFTEAQEFLEYSEKNQVDLLFLDIELGDMTGIDISFSIRKENNNNRTQIVYITGKEGYERQLFDFQPLNFIEKPLDENKIKECVDMAYRRLIKGKKQFKYIKNYEHCFIPIRQIVSFETSEKKVVMNLLTGKEEFRSSMNKIDEQLAGDGFIRINQAVIVNIQYIQRYDGTLIVMRNNEKYYVSRSKSKKVKHDYMQYLLEHWLV